jgi:adenylate cyclase
MTTQKVTRKLTAILSADVKGYSRLMGDDEEWTVRTLTVYKDIMGNIIHQHRGRVVDAPGDNLLAEFASVVDAVQCALEIQEELGSRNGGLPVDRKMDFRIGVNLGDVIVEDDRIYGDGVNTAARLQELAEGGGVCISGTVYDQIEGKLQLKYEFLGEKMVKNIKKPVRAYSVGEGKGPTLSRKPGRSELPDKPSIVVLPFVNMNGDPQLDYLSDGITENLITNLSKISSLFVISSNSTFTYKGKAVKVEQVGEELGVRYVLEGSVQKADRRLRITAQLIDAVSGYHLWGERYDRDMEDIFLLQDDVTEKIIAALRVKVEKAEIERVLRKPSESLEAYDYALRGRAYVYATTKEQNARAQECFKVAIDLDPRFAGAYVGLGWACFNNWVHRWITDPQSSLDTAIELAQKAIVLDPSLPSAYRLLGECHLWKRQYEQAIGEIETAIALDPNDAENYAELSGALVWVGRHEEALAQMEKAMRLNPFYPVMYPFGLGLAQFMMQKREEAIASFKKVLTRAPDFLWAHLLLALVFVEADRMEEARAEVSEVLRIDPNCSAKRLGEMVPFRDQTVMEEMVAALRKAGLGE